MKKISLVVFILLSVSFGYVHATQGLTTNSDTPEDSPSPTELQIMSQLRDINSNIASLQAQLNTGRQVNGVEKGFGFSEWTLTICGFLSIVNLVLLILLLRKNEENVSTNPENSIRKENEKTSVEAYESILKIVQTLKSSVTRIDENVSSLLKKNVSNQQQSIQHQPNQQVEKKTTVQNNRKEEKPKQPILKTLYVQPETDGNIIKLIDGGEDYKNMMPFVIMASGNEGRVSFNPSCIDMALNSLETAIIPYSICKIETKSQPTRILTQNAGRAEFRNMQWILVSKPELQVL